MRCYFSRNARDLRNSLARLTGEDERERNCRIALIAFVSVSLLIVGTIGLIKFLERNDDDFDEEDFEDDDDCEE
jgi:hypothetical protein